MNTATEDIADLLGGIGRTPVDTAPLQIGRLTSYDGTLLEASGLAAPVGTVCRIETASDEAAEAEVIGFKNGRCILMSLGQRADVLPDARVFPQSNQSRVEVGDGLLGRVIDGAGLPLDGFIQFVGGAQRARQFGRSAKIGVSGQLFQHLAVFKR